MMNAAKNISSRLLPAVCRRLGSAFPVTIYSFTRNLFQTDRQSQPSFHSVRCNSNRATIAKIGRLNYLRMYPTMVVLPDGSTISIRYKEPRRIIKLPLDVSTLTEEEQRARLARRRPKTVVKMEEQIAPNFNPTAYVSLMKKKK